MVLLCFLTCSSSEFTKLFPQYIPLYEQYTSYGSSRQLLKSADKKTQISLDT